MKNVEFTCPKCGKIHLEEIMVGVTVFSTLKNITVEDGVADCDYENPTNEDGELNRYQCEICGHALTINGDTVNDLEGLARWFEINSPNEDQT